MWSLFLFSFRYIQQIIRVFDGWITNAHKWSCTTLQIKKLQPRHFVSRWFAQTIQWWQGINVSEEMINPKVRWMLACKTGAIFFAFHRRARGGSWSGIHARQGKAPSSPCVSRALEAGEGKRWRTGKGKRGTFSLSSWRKKEEEQPDLRIDDWSWTEY